MADQEAAGLEIGRLRWLVTLASRVQTPDPGSAGVLETITGPVQVHADVQAVGALTFYGGEDTDAPFTHRIFMRWHEYLDQTKAVLRTTQPPDRMARTEIFRVKRIKELGGRKRFVLIECVLEKVTTASMPPAAPAAGTVPAASAPIVSPSGPASSTNDTDIVPPFVQAAPADPWTIHHNLGRYPDVLVVSTNGDKIEPGNVNYPDLGTVIITFGVPTAGTAELI